MKVKKKPEIKEELEFPLGVTAIRSLLLSADTKNKLRYK